MEEMEKDIEFVLHDKTCTKLLPPPPPPPPQETDATTENAIVKYRECQKNHSRVKGGYVVDGCGEFLGSGEEGTLEALICAVCNCHRSFHRKEINGGVDMSSYPYTQPPVVHYHNNQVSPFYNCMPPPPPPPGVVGYHHHVLVASPVSQHFPIAQPIAYDGGCNLEENDMSNPKSGGGSHRAKKRFRTKFSKEQKDKMAAFAEKVGWRMRKHDGAVVDQFCAETGVKRQVFNVWMHNNKHTLGKKTT